MAMKFKKKEKIKKVPWKDGAILVFEFPSLMEVLKGNNKLFDSKNEQDISSAGIDYLFEGLKGWESIEDEETGTPLEFNAETKKLVFDMMLTDQELIKDITTVLKGPFPN